MYQKTKAMFTLCCLALLCNALHAQLPSDPNFVITHSGEVMIAEKIAYTDLKSSGLNLTLTMSNGPQKTLSGREVFRFKITQDKKVTFYQVAAIDAGKRTKYTAMRLHNSGKLSLLSQRRQGMNWPFVTGAGFNDFITATQNYGKLMTLLNQCEAFRVGYDGKKGKKLKRLKEMIAFYNLYCGKEETKIEAQEINIKGCIFLGLNEVNVVINSQQELAAAVKKDASRSRCINELSSIDWENYSLVGNNISSGNCARPSGLGFTCDYATGTNTMYVNIVYEENQPLCRALSKYDYWLLIPRKNTETTMISRISTIDQSSYEE